MGRSCLRRGSSEREFAARAGGGVWAATAGRWCLGVTSKGNN